MMYKESPLKPMYGHNHAEAATDRSAKTQTTFFFFFFEAACQQ